MIKILRLQFLFTLSAVWLFQFSNAQSLTYGSPFDLTLGVSVEGTPVTITEITSTEGMEFSNDGSKLFVVGTSGAAALYQYSLSTPFSISDGMTYDGSPLTISGEEPTAFGVAFSNDGMTMFVVGRSSDAVIQYDLTNPFDITSGVTVDPISYDFSTQETDATDITFNAAGTKMYLIGFDASIYQYSLSNAFDITSGVTYDGSPFDVSGQQIFPSAMTFSEEGSKVFVAGFNKEIYSYSLANPFNITSGVTYDGSPLDITDQSTSPRGIVFNSEGSKLLVMGLVGASTVTLDQYNLSKGNFSEATSNDGSLTGSVPIHISGEVFTNANGSFAHKNQYSILNIPAGVIPSMTISADGLIATLTLSGSATDHQKVNDMESLQFTFTDGAFDGGDASAVSNANNASSGISVLFDDNPGLTYGFTFDLSNGASTVGSPFSIASEDTSPVDIVFSTNGMKMFVLGGEDDDINQYSLATAFDVTSGVTFDGSPFDVSGQETSPEGLAFSADGTKMFVVGWLGVRNVNQYSLSNPFDITSGVTYDNVAFSVNNEESFPRGLTFNKEGSKMYILGNGNNIYQYSLDNHFNISSGVTYDGSPYSVASEEAGSKDLTFSTDGSKMLIIGSTGDDINQYSLSVPFDITSTVAFDGTPFSVAANQNNPTGLAFNSDGSSFVVIGNTGDDIDQYEIDFGGFSEAGTHDGAVLGSLVIKIDGDTFTSAASTLSSESDYSISNLPSGLTPKLSIAADGLTGTLTLGGKAHDHQATDNISDLLFTFENSAFANADASMVLDATNAQSGAQIDFNDNNAAITYGYYFDMANGAVFSGSPFSVSSQTTAPSGLVFSPDGTKMFVIESDADEVYQYNLTNPFDILQGVTFTGKLLSLTNEVSSLVGIAFSTDGSKLFALDLTNTSVHQYSLSNAFDIGIGVTYDGTPFSVATEESLPSDLAFSTDGTKMFVIGRNDQNVDQYSLSSPFNITTGVTFDATEDISEESIPLALSFSTDGTKMFVIGNTGKDVNQYSLSSPFDITSNFTFENSTFSVSSQEGFPSGMAFNTNGSRMFIIGSQGDDVNQYDLNVGGFEEDVADDGSVEGSLEIRAFGDNAFTNSGATLTIDTDYSINNLPDGLIPDLAVNADGLSAVLTFSGNALDHSLAENISSLQFTFENTAFTNVRAATVTNAVNAESNIAIDFTDNFAAPTDISLDNTSIDENEASGTVVGTLSTTDIDAGETYTYTLVAGTGDTDNASFIIEDNKLKSAAMFDFETKDSYSIRVNTNDGNGGDFAKSFTISINDLSETITWSGTAWSNGTGPSASDDAIINGDYSVATDGSFEAALITINTGNTLTVDAGSTLDVVGGLVNNGSLEVESGSSLLTYAANSVSGNDIEISRDTRYADGKYSFVGTPVEQDASIIGSDLGTFVFKYNEVTPYGMNEGLMRWETASADELVPGKGYTQANQKEIIFLGTPNTGTINYNGTYTEDTDDANEGWNLVANPYAAAINVSSFLTENMNTSGSVYIWDDNGSSTQRGSNADYIVANASMATTTAAGGQSRYNFHLGSAQGFFIKFDDNTDTEITFTETMRVSGSNADDNFFRKEPLPIVRLNLTDSKGLFKQTVIGFADDATELELKQLYDAQAFNAASTYGLFTVKAGRSLALNGMPQNWHSVQLQLNVEEAGTYQISVELENYAQSVYLRDNLTDEIIDLSQQSYSFQAEAGINTDRFELLSSPSGVLGLENNDLLVYAHQSILHIHQQDDEAREYQLFNMNGQKLLTQSVKGKAEINVSSYSKGIYLVFDGEKTHKIILK